MVGSSSVKAIGSVLSLCDGISCGAVALKNIGIEVERYYGSEIKKTALALTRERWPAHIELGDVTKIDVSRSGNSVKIDSRNGTYTEENGIDLFLCGSPCQSFSKAMPTEKRTGLSDQKRSGLFLKCYDIFKTVKPRYFLFENVASMKESDRNTLSEMIGVEPVYIDSADFSAQTRKRLYWTNIPLRPRPPVCPDVLQDVLDSGVAVNIKQIKDIRKMKTVPSPTYNVNLSKGRCICAMHGSSMTEKAPRFAVETSLLRNQSVGLAIPLVCDKDGSAFSSQWLREHPDFLPDINDWRALKVSEYERLQTLPQGYTSMLSRKDAVNTIGDGWTVKVIEYILSGLLGT